jgi:hypothetical protein
MAPVALDQVRDLVADAQADGRAIAVGWATVELDRAAYELARELGLSPEVFLPAADSELLGARCRVAAGVLPGGHSLAILEPNTEGLLAASLARHGEGPVAVWSTADDAAARDDGATRNGARPSPGPFGPERRVPGGPLHGPYRLLIGSAPGTIAS